ncbi:flagellar hook-basal body complex protein [Parerythrobacter jejuensis]|uniref:Flagellar hook-basal body complex protein n=1 Tax=Parerythrobacter jejuensis TaxID=795812 RepID=A0A845ASN3_9SPHN|nr:flagellar hook basal-body protein [Parerythrobacter jejuensis]MXP30560.1 flagellar hook-basal body complex protein [Parerythrobacter jejuensis]MXP33320.1 flagellar hook-basal body complex protein [Parerythrobacter jejuensis]
MGLLETAAATLIGGERRVETAARNVTNVNTPGYKREIAYTELIEKADAARGPSGSQPTTASTTLSTQGTLSETGNPLDLAINGSAQLLLRDGDQFVLSRGGQFGIGADGTLVDALGRILQQAGGGDLELASATADILIDGTVLEDDVPVGAIGLFSAEDIDTDARFTREQVGTLVEDDTSELKQGMIERSNVTLSEEMVEMMRNQRQVESGAQLVRAYDQLMSQAISTFSRSGS